MTTMELRAKMGYKIAFWLLVFSGLMLFYFGTKVDEDYSLYCVVAANLNVFAALFLSLIERGRQTAKHKDNGNDTRNL